MLGVSVVQVLSRQVGLYWALCWGWVMFRNWKVGIACLDIEKWALQCHTRSVWSDPHSWSMPWPNTVLCLGSPCILTAKHAMQLCSAAQQFSNMMHWPETLLYSARLWRPGRKHVTLIMAMTKHWTNAHELPCRFVALYWPLTATLELEQQ